MSTSTGVSLQCNICSADAVYSYFGVKSCDACKVFFKWNIEKQTVSSKRKGWFLSVYLII